MPMPREPSKEGAPTPPRAFIVVDMQEYFCSSESSLGRLMAITSNEGADWYQQRLATTVVPNIARLLSDARAGAQRVFFTEFGSREPDGTDLPIWAKRHNDTAVALVGERCYLPLADPASRVIDELAPTVGETVVTKTTSGPLAGTDIDVQLRVAGVETVIVTGVATNVCVTGMARELADAGFDVYVVTNACATSGEQTHDAALEIVATFATLIDTDTASDLLNGKDPTDVATSA